MENLDGALGFKSTLDIDDFTVSAQAMEKQIRHTSTVAQAETADMENSLLQFAQRGAVYIATYLVGQGMSGLLQSIAQTRGQFQQLEIAFETMLGSGTQAQSLMNQMIQTAAKTPFDLMGVAGGAKQLMAYGLAADKVNDTLIKLGNIASGLSIPLNDIVYLYGTTMVQGRLYAQDVRQFTGRGIPLVRELADMYGVTAEKINEMVTAGKIGFADVEKVLNKLTGAGGQFYNLMEKQSASLTGMISNLEDAWDNMLNEIGKENQDLFSGAIGMASSLVENYQKILDVLKAVAVGYGSVKAAIVLNTLVTKGYTGVALIDNTARAAKLTLLKAEAALTGQTKAQAELMAAATERNVAALQAELTAEELTNLQKRLRVAAIAELLTAQQQEYLSTLGLTTSSQSYEAEAMKVLSVEQQEALSKLDLTGKSETYRVALEQEVLIKKANRVATLEAMRADVKEAALRIEVAKQRAIASQAVVEEARLDVYWAKASGNATAVAAAEEKLAAAVEQQSVTRKAALAAQSEFYAKKKALEAEAIRQSTAASVTDTTAKTAQTAATSVLSAVTHKATLAVKTFWAAMKANPLGWILSIVGLVVSAFTLFRKRTDESTTAAQEFTTRTKSEIDTLKMYYSVLQNTEAGTRSHTEALNKINGMCKEYNTTLLKENSTLEDQKKRYDELTKAIQNTTAEKIKAKHIDEISQATSETESDALKDLEKQAGRAKYVQSTSTIQSSAGAYTQTNYAKSQNIRNASGAFWELVEAETIDRAAKLKQLTGEEYGKAFNDLIATLEGMLKNNLNATDKELAGFRSSLVSYATEIVNAERSAAEQTARLNKELTTESKEAAASVDYMSMSFGDLDKEAANVQRQIDQINAKQVKVDVDFTKLNQLQNQLTQIQAATGSKTNNLNTESDINARIKELREQKEQAVINSAEYKKLNSEITKLQNRLPKTGEQAAQKQEALNQKQLEAQRAVEEARISVMEEGFEKRQAVLDLQHKRNLDKINQQEKELADARKKAGKGSLTDSQKEGFENMRAAENASYDKAQEKLFDGEIEYKKEQYKLYFQWVKNVGKEVADQHFESLLQAGSSFSAWVSSQISTLESKRDSNPESFSIGDANALNQLLQQQEQINGTRTAMDAFKDSVSNAFAQASNLAEKLQAIADLKEQLSNGDFKLNEDETTEAAFMLNEDEREAQQELHNKIINDFKSFEERKAEITSQYNAMRLTETAQSNEELLARLNKAETDALSEQEVAQLQASADWQNLFQNLDYLSADEISKLVQNIESKLQSTNLKLSPVDYRALLQSLNDAKEKITTINPFKSLGESFSKYIKSLKELKEAQKKNLSKDELSNFKDAVISNAAQCANAIGQINQTTSTVGGAIASVADSFGADGKTSAIIEGVSGALSGAGKAAGGVAKIMSGDIVGGIQDCISGIADFIVSLNGMSDAMHEENIKDLQKEIDSLADSYDNLGESIERAYSSNKANLLEQQSENLRKQNQKIRQQIREEEDKKKTDSERIKEWEKQIAENEKEIAENTKYNIVEAIMGTDVASAIDDFANAYAEAWAAGENAAKRSASTVKNVIKTAIIEQLKNKLQPEVESFMSYLATALKDGVISESEEAMLDEYKRRLDEQQQDYLQKTGKWLQGDETQVDALTGAVRGMSEETGGLVAGRMNAVVINQSQQMEILRNALIYQAEIAHNTGVSAEKLTQIQESVKRIENRENNLLSQGIS
jgi:tape measure domain-containing protein